VESPARSSNSPRRFRIAPVAVFETGITQAYLPVTLHISGRERMPLDNDASRSRNRPVLKNSDLGHTGVSKITAVSGEKIYCAKQGGSKKHSTGVSKRGNGRK
jgi:putative hemolysin